MTEFEWDWTRQDSMGGPRLKRRTIDNETLRKIEKLLSEEHHVIQFTDQGWTIAHPLQERIDGSLFDCRIFWDKDDPRVRGRFWLLDDGSIGDYYE